MHHKRWLKHGDPNVARRPRAVCAIEGCEEPAVGRGWCSAHWQRWRKHGDPNVNVGGPKHGLSRTRVYASWTSMIARCTSPKHMHWKLYGGRVDPETGEPDPVKIHPPWLGSEDGLVDFILHVGPRPLDPAASEKAGKPVYKSLDRIDPAGHYEPGNVRWATAKEQQANRRDRQKAV